MEDGEGLEVQALKDSPAYGARNVQIVAAGTGEALPGPATCGWCCRAETIAACSVLLHHSAFLAGEREIQRLAEAVRAAGSLLS